MSDTRRIKVQEEKKERTIEVNKGIMLHKALIDAGYEIFSPCGGNGTCGKCKVHIKDHGFVTSCLHAVNEDIEVLLPGKAEAKILVSQYEYTRKLPFNPGMNIQNSAFPMGIAIDIGTTSVVFYLVNLLMGSAVETRAFMNPQIKYGSDVISRINHCINNPEGLEKLQAEIIGLINDQVADLASAAGVSPNEIIKISVAGNTTMLHILLGADPSSLAFVPFKPVFTDRKTLKAKEYGIQSNPETELIVLPSVSAYVGADIVAGLASLDPPENIKNYLFIDIGTNGEMALVKGKEVWVCATAAGPAFEGANISCGMAAVEGAISAYNDKGFETVGNIDPKGICGSGLIDICAYMVEKKLVQPDGLLENEYVISDNSNEKISINQQDIRELQLAKSAIVSGIKILIKNAETSFEALDALFLAGGFGNYIKLENAVKIGLFPMELSNKVIPVGNSSGSGAVLALKSEQFYPIVDELAQKTRFIELNDDPDFAMEFAMNMSF